VFPDILLIAALAWGAFAFGAVFSLQMPGNAALFAVMCGIALHKGPERRMANEPRRA
jgi:hypothetical protein